MSKRTLHGFFGGGSSSSKKAKPGGGDSSPPRPVFIVCPGAGGVLPKDGTLEAQLGRVGRVVAIAKDTGYKGAIGCTAGAKGVLSNNLRIVTDTIAREVKDMDDATPIVLVGQSFGCRAIVHWMCGNHEVRKHPSIPTPWSGDVTPENYQTLRDRISCVLFFGYPLAHDSQDRSAALKLLPAPVRALFVMGTSDKQSLGDGLSQSNFQDVLTAAPAATEIVWVDRGGHSPPNSSKWTSAGLTTKIKTFVARANGGATSGGENGGDAAQKAAQKK